MKTLRRLFAVAAALTMVIPHAAAEQLPPDLDLGVNLGSGTTAWVPQQLQQQNAKTECLNAVRKWRQDALNTGVRWPTPSSGTMASYLASQGISTAEYLNPKWSLDLEYLALARVVETQTHGIRGHERPNGDELFDLKRNAVQADGEVIAYGRTNCTEAIDAFAGEKTDWVNLGAGETGHYQFLIDPAETHYGFAGSSGPLPTPDSPWYFSNVWLGLGAGAWLPESVNESAMNLSGAHMVPVQLADGTVQQGAAMNVDALSLGEQLTAHAKLKAFAGRFYLRGTWTSSNPSIVAVTPAGHVHAKSVGSATLTLRTKEGKTFSQQVTVAAGGVDRAGGKNRYGTAVAFTKAHFPAGASSMLIASGADYPDALAAAAVAGAMNVPVLLVPNGQLPDEVRSELSRLNPGVIVAVGGAGAISDDTLLQVLDAVPGAEIARAAGPNRFATAADLAVGAFDGGAETVYVASGMDFPDALTAAAAAGHNHGPVLLTLRDQLPDVTAKALRDLQPKRVVVVGGGGVVNAQVAGKIQQLTGAQLERRGGADRFETAKLVATNEFIAGSNRIVVANAYNYPDALVGAAVAGMHHSPVLLTAADRLTPPAIEALRELKPINVTVAGGSAVVSEAVRQQIASTSGLALK